MPVSPGATYNTATQPQQFLLPNTPTPPVSTQPVGPGPTLANPTAGNPGIMPGGRNPFTNPSGQPFNWGAYSDPQTAMAAALNSGYFQSQGGNWQQALVDSYNQHYGLGAGSSAAWRGISGAPGGGVIEAPGGGYYAPGPNGAAWGYSAGDAAGGGSMGGGTDPSSIMAQDPGYQFRFLQGLQALQRSAAANGTLLTGGTGKELTRYGQDYASGEFQNIFNRNLSLAQLGENAAATGAYTGSQFANAAANTITGAGNAQAAGTVGGANAINQGIAGANNLTNYLAWLNSQNRTQTQTSYTGNPSNYNTF